MNIQKQRLTLEKVIAEKNLFTPELHYDILNSDHVYWGDPTYQDEFTALWKKLFVELQHADGVRPEGLLPYNYEQTMRQRQVNNRDIIQYQQRKKNHDHAVRQSIRGDIKQDLSNRQQATIAEMRRAQRHYATLNMVDTLIENWR